MNRVSVLLFIGNRDSIRIAKFGQGLGWTLLEEHPGEYGNEEVQMDTSIFHGLCNVPS